VPPLFLPQNRDTMENAETDDDDGESGAGNERCILDTREDERQWFTDNLEGVEGLGDALGVDALLQRLDKLMTTHIRTRWVPSIKQLVARKKAENEAALLKLGTAAREISPASVLSTMTENLARNSAWDGALAGVFGSALPAEFGLRGHSGRSATWREAFSRSSVRGYVWSDGHHNGSPLQKARVRLAECLAGVRTLTECCGAMAGSCDGTPSKHWKRASRSSSVGWQRVSR
jgi:hypothetical protein